MWNSLELWLPLPLIRASPKERGQRNVRPGVCLKQPPVGASLSSPAHPIKGHRGLVSRSLEHSHVFDEEQTPTQPRWEHCDFLVPVAGDRRKEQ